MNRMTFLFDGLKMDWENDEIEKFRSYWEYQLSIEEIAKLLRCSEWEVILLALDQMRKRKIEEADILPKRKTRKWKK